MRMCARDGLYSIEVPSNKEYRKSVYHNTNY